jgi:hypothetical protein
MANGSVIGPTNDPTAGSASGIWKLNELYQAVLDSNWPGLQTTVEYLVIAGGGGGGFNRAGGGGAGGYRTNFTSSAPTPSPKASGGGGSVESAFTATFGTAYTVTLGAGGAGATAGGSGGINGPNRQQRVRQSLSILTPS